MTLFGLRGSIRKKLVILFLLSALPGAFYILASGLHDRSILIKRAEQDLLRFVNEIAEIQGQSTNNIHNMLAGLARLHEVKSGNVQACLKLFSEILDSNPNYTAMHLSDRYGNIIVTSLPGKPKTFSGAKVFKDAIANKGFSTGEYYSEPIIKEPVFVYGHAVKTIHDEIIGVLFISIKLSRYVEIFKKTQFPSESYLTICDYKGVRLFSYPGYVKSPIGGKIRPETIRIANKVASPGIVIIKNTDGIKRVRAHHLLRFTPDSQPYMYIFAAVPASVIYLNAQGGLWRNLTALLLSIGLAILMGWLFGGKKLGMKLEELADASREIGGGDLSVRVIADSNITELKVLENAFNNMIQALLEDKKTREKLSEEQIAILERLQRSEKMEAMGLLAGGVAHDLNNSLGILIGYAQLLYDTFDEADSRREDMQKIIKGGWQATSIIQDLLTMSRSGIGVKNIINLNTVISRGMESQECTNVAAVHPDVRISTELDENLLLIDGSVEYLEKALINLVINAADAMKDGGEILIQTENRYLDKPVSGYDAINEGDYVILTVSDEGEGLSAENMKHLFMPFYTKKVMGRSGVGTGLGLSVVWGTVKEHDGYIDVKSEPGKGTTFYLYFPVSRGKEQANETVAGGEGYTGHFEKILVVDDVESQRELARRILEKLNYRVDTVSSGKEAVDYIKLNQADLIVLDMVMDPGIDGCETYRQITEIRPGQQAIIVSGFADSNRIKTALSLGAGAFVKKPYMKESLGIAVRKELDKR